MARKTIWTPEKYKTVVGGDSKLRIPGLRSLVKGFEPSDGFKLRDPESWTKAQRAKVRKWHARIETLQSQPKRIVRARGENLRKLQEGFHGDIPSAELKVAFIPDTEPALTLPGSKKRLPRIRILKEGISISRSNYTRTMIPFNKKNLVKRARDEIKRVASKMPNATRFYIQAAQYQTVNGHSLNSIIDYIIKLMHTYDGKRALPRGSDNRGDSPKYHKWDQWLDGLVGYAFSKKLDLKKMASMLREGREKNKKLRAARRRYMRRKGRVGRLD